MTPPVRKISKSMPCKRRRPTSLIECHFEVSEDFELLGALRHDPNVQRDVHDWFNLIFLVPLVVLDLMNWTCPDAHAVADIFSGKSTVIDLWTGNYWGLFWCSSFAYFVFDLAFVLIMPRCVRSPGVIVTHHVVTILYIMIPALYPEVAWLMGSCMMVEINTWFLIARRSFNKLGSKPFKSGVSIVKSLRLVFISWSFYISWFVIRIFLYPYLLYIIVGVTQAMIRRAGTCLHPVIMCPVVHSSLICLNTKWTIDLVRSKLKSNTKEKSKGL